MRAPSRTQCLHSKVRTQPDSAAYTWQTMAASRSKQTELMPPMQCQSNSDKRSDSAYDWTAGFEPEHESCDYANRVPKHHFRAFCPTDSNLALRPAMWIMTREPNFCSEGSEEGLLQSKIKDALSWFSQSRTSLQSKTIERQ